MFDRKTLIEKRRALVQGIVASARQDAYAAFQHTGKQKYRREDAPVTPAVIEGHLSGQQPIAIYTVIEDKTSAAVLDFDDHDKCMDWAEIVASAGPIVEMLQAKGLRPLCCRSGGGSGLHIWLVWRHPQSARHVKHFLNYVIEANGFKNGTGGVHRREIEVFPKNDFVKEGSYGNAVAPPFSRKSVPLNAELMPIDWAVYVPPSIDELYCPDVSDLYQPAATRLASTPLEPSSSVPSLLNCDVLVGNEEDVRSALKVLDADDYDTWIRVGFALKHSLGAGAFDIWNEWSATSAKYPEHTKCREVWDGFLPDGTLTIATVYYTAQQKGWIGPTNTPFRHPIGRPTIVLRGGQLPAEVDQAEEALLKANLGVYQRGENLVRVARLAESEADDGVRRPSGALLTLAVTPTWLREKFAISAEWLKPGREADIPINPPIGHAMALLARAGEWKAPVLVGVVSCPTMRRDGSILQAPGYDRASGLLYDPGAAVFPIVPESPTMEEAAAALAVLARPFREYLFATEGDRAVVLAACMTAVIRRILPAAPLFAVDAPTAGSGKSLLCETIGIIASGYKPTIISQGKTPEEDEKRLSSILMAGDAVLVIDNCDRPLGGDTLCSMLTQEIIASRVLGKSEVKRMPTNALVMATGNNLDVVGDLGRRTLVCRIDTGAERPDQLVHGFSPTEEAMRDRPDLVVAALTVLRAYVVAGRPGQLPPIGSFEDWNLVREALVWLGEDDPTVTRERVMSDDPRKGEVVELLELWREVLGGQAMTLAEIEKKASIEQRGRTKDLLQALADRTPKGAFNAWSVGKYLARHKDRFVGGRVLRRIDDPSGVKRYRVELANSPPPVDSPF